MQHIYVALIFLYKSNNKRHKKSFMYATHYEIKIISFFLSDKRLEMNASLKDSKRYTHRKKRTVAKRAPKSSKLQTDIYRAN